MCGSFKRAVTFAPVPRETCSERAWVSATRGSVLKRRSLSDGTHGKKQPVQLFSAAEPTLHATTMPVTQLEIALCQQCMVMANRALVCCTVLQHWSHFGCRCLRCQLRRHSLGNASNVPVTFLGAVCVCACSSTETTIQPRYFESLDVRCSLLLCSLRGSQAVPRSLCATAQSESSSCGPRECVAV